MSDVKKLQARLKWAVIEAVKALPQSRFRSTRRRVTSVIGLQFNPASTRTIRTAIQELASVVRLRKPKAYVPLELPQWVEQAYSMTAPDGRTVRVCHQFVPDPTNPKPNFETTFHVGIVE